MSDDTDSNYDTPYHVKKGADSDDSTEPEDDTERPIAGCTRPTRVLGPHTKREIHASEIPEPVKRKFKGDHEIGANQCICCGQWFYMGTPPESDKVHFVTARGNVAHDLHNVDDGTYSKAADGYKPDAADGHEEWICNDCYADAGASGNDIKVISPTGDRTMIGVKEGYLRERYYSSSDDIALEDQPTHEAVDALVAGQETLPFDPGCYAATNGDGTADRIIESEEMIRVFVDYDRPRDVPAGYPVQRSFIEAIFDKKVIIPTAAIGRGSRLFVPKSDVEMVRERFEDFARER